MNFPTSDLQFIAQMLIKTRSGDQIVAADAERLERIASTGVGHVLPEPEIARPVESEPELGGQI